MSSKIAEPAHSDPVNHEGSGWKDVIFAVAFIAHLAAIGYVAFAYKDQIDFQKEPTADSSDFDPRVLYTTIAAMLASIAFGFVWMNVLKRFSHGIIKFCLLASVAFTCVLGLFAFAANPVLALFFFLIAGLQALYYYFVRRRIAVSTICLFIIPIGTSNNSLQDANIVCDLFISVHVCIT